MNVASLIARLLLGLIFTAIGIMSFFNTNPPPMSGLTGEFLDAYMKSHFSLFVAAAQLVIGLLFLSNRFVPLALIMLAAFLYNSFAFHITLLPVALFAPLITLGLWILVAWPYRSLFAPIFKP